MKFNRRCQLWRSAAKEAGRYAMQNASLEGTRFVATNGRALAVVTIEREKGDVDGLIPTDAVKTAAKAGDKRSDATIESEDGQLVVRDAEKETFFDRPTGEFPKWAGFVPSAPLKAVKTIGFNPELLFRLAQSIGMSKDGSVRLEFRGEDMPIKVLIGEGEEYGVLMPVTFDGEQAPVIDEGEKA